MPEVMEPEPGNAGRLTCPPKVGTERGLRHAREYRALRLAVLAGHKVQDAGEKVGGTWTHRERRVFAVTLWTRQRPAGLSTPFHRKPLAPRFAFRSPPG